MKVSKTPVVRGFSHTWKSKGSCSRRTVATSKMMQQTSKAHPSSKVQHRRSQKKAAKLAALFQVPMNQDKAMMTTKADGTFFPFAPEDLQLHHHNEGAVHWLNKDEGVFSFLKIPRECVLDKVNENNTAKVVQALELLQKTESNTKRSKGKTGVSSCKAKYTVFGVKAHQGRHGFVHDKISKIQKYFKQTCALKKFVRRLEDVAAEFVPTSWLRAIAKANKCEAWPTVAGGFVAAMASSINYWAPAHKDEDFLFSIHQVNIVGQLHSTDIVQYFCFPTLGFAIGLCPGDVILFNPHVHHCLSAKSPRYEDVDVHVTTMYVKTAHAGLNNNSIPLTEEQETYYSINLH